MAKRTVRTERVKHGGGPYSQAVRAGGFVFVSGQTGVDPNGKLLKGTEAQTRQAMKNVQAILEAAEAKMSDVVQVRVYIADLANYGAMNRVYTEFFADEAPSRACVRADLPEGAQVEFVVTAFVG